MAKRQRLTLQPILKEIFMDPLSENDEEDHPEEDDSDSDDYSPETDREVAVNACINVENTSVLLNQPL